MNKIVDALSRIHEVNMHVIEYNLICINNFEENTLMIFSLENSRLELNLKIMS